MDKHSEEIYNRGLEVLVRDLGVIQTEEFISLIKRETFDYTKWRRNYFDSMKDGEFTRAAAEYGKAHPHEVKAGKDRTRKRKAFMKRMDEKQPSGRTAEEIDVEIREGREDRIIR